MEIYNYISYKAILEQAKDDFKFMIGNISELEVKQWLSRLIAVSNAFNVLTNKIEFLQVEHGRVSTPDDMALIISIAKSHYDTIPEAECAPCEVTAMRWNTGDVNCRSHFVPMDFYVNSNYRYNINDSSIFTEFDSGVIKVAYKGLPVDANGDPSIPDTGSWQEAAIHELAWKVARNLYFMDKFDERKLQRIEKDRDWYVAQAINSSKHLSRPQREVFKDNWMKFVKDLYPEDSGMHSLADREYTNWHGKYLNR